MDSTQVNWPEVADKILNYGERTMGLLSEKIQEVSPYVWELTQRQVIAEAYMWLFVPIALVVVSIIWCGVALWKNWDFGFSFSFGVFIVCMIGLCFNGGNLYLVLNNPDYYTIKRIMEITEKLL